MKIVQNFNVLSFAAFLSVNWLGFVVVCVGWFFWFVCLCYFGGGGRSWASTGLQFFILCFDLFIQLCVFADVHSLKQDCN